VLAALAACSHGEPFAVPSFGTDQLLAPTRLTWSGDADFEPAWLPDSTGLLYTGDRRDVGDVRCVMVLPPTGGRATTSSCPAAADTFNVFRSAAANADGLIAFVREDRRRGQSFAGVADLAVARLDHMRRPHVLHFIPMTFPGQPTFNAVHQVRWLDGVTLIYRGGFDGYACPLGGPCGGGAAVFVSSGYALVRQPADTLLGDPAVIPGTDNASSVAVADGDAIFFTVTGEGRVYRLVLSTGAISVVYDLPGAIVRDVQVAGNRLVVVAGGNVVAFQGAGTGLVQFDTGGDLVVVDIATGAGVTLNAPNTFYQHPVVSSDGGRLVAESGGDLWLFDVP